MSGDACKTKKLKNIIVQENGIIRNSRGRIIGRTVDDVDFESKHLDDQDTTIENTEGDFTLEK